MTWHEGLSREELIKLLDFFWDDVDPTSVYPNGDGRYVASTTGCGCCADSAKVPDEVDTILKKIDKARECSSESS